MPSSLDLADSVLTAWRTNHRVTVFLLQSLPRALWSQKVPGCPRRTVRMIAGHIHNARCMWIKWLGREHGVTVPRSVDRHRVTPAKLIAALNRSGKGIEALLQLGLEDGGVLPAKVPYRNVPNDVVHVLAYLVAHEGHHRGQICLLARQLGHRLPTEVTNGLWQWSKRAAEVSS
ncbi:MAG: DinB family protein [Gemmatimonadota bacterium]|nr:DinB family protein [Gemmatimonadota bacterium]